MSEDRSHATHQFGDLVAHAVTRPGRVLGLPVRLAATAYRELCRRVPGDGSRATLLRDVYDRGQDALRRLPGGLGDLLLVPQVYRGDYRIELPAARPVTAPVPGRILHLLEYSLPHQQNGYTIRSARIVDAQRAHGLDPRVVTRPGFPPGATADEPDVVAGVPHYRLPGRALRDNPNLVAYLREYVTEAAALVERLQPEIIQAASNFRNAYAAAELARRYRLPFVYEVRGLWEETRVANGRLARGDRKYRRLVDVETYCMRAADAVVTLGSSLKAEFVRRGIDADKIFIVPNTVDTDAAEDRPPRDDLRGSLGLDGRFVVSYIGSVSPLEGLHHLIDAIGHLRRQRSDIAALIVGDGMARADLERLARARGLSPWVRFAGAVPFADIPDYYALSDAIVCTRGRHRVCELVTPLKPYEAMAYRKPVVVSDIPALREVVTDGQTGRVVPAEDPAALARAVAALADDPAGRVALGEAARAWVREHSSRERVAAMYREAYDHAREAFAARTQDYGL